MWLGKCAFEYGDDVIGSRIGESVDSGKPKHERFLLDFPVG